MSIRKRDESNNKGNCCNNSFIDEETLQKDRLFTLDKFVECFNHGNQELMQDFLFEQVHPDAALEFKTLGRTVTGRNAIVLYWLLNQECFPGAVVKILERHYSSPLSKIECIYKMSGTPVSSTNAVAVLMQFILIMLS